MAKTFTSVREALDRGEVMLGTFHDFVDPLVMELVGFAGFDYVILDHVQSMTDFRNLVNCIRGAEVAGTSPIVRIAEPIGYTAERILSAGAEGLILSRAGSKAQVEEFVARAYFAPKGRRGSTYIRGDLWKPATNGRQRQLEANDRVVTFAIIEDREGLANVEQIVEVPELTGIVPGHGDLSLDMGGLPWDHPDVLDALDHIIEVAREAGKHLMIPCLDPAKVQATIDRGALMLMMNHDTILVGDMYSALHDAMRTEVKPQRDGR